MLDDEGAIRNLKIARDLLPEYGDVLNPRQSLADLYETRGDETAMLRELDDTDPASAYTDLARAYLSGGKKGEAENSALLALEIAPTFERAQNILLDSLEPEMISR